MAEELQELKNKSFKGLPLSVVIITCKEDESFLRGCLGSIPRGTEVVIAYTEPANVTDYNVVQENRFRLDTSYSMLLSNLEVIELKIEFPQRDLNLSKCRNIAKSFAQRPLILMLDTDERVSMPMEIIQELNKLAVEDTTAAYYVLINNYGDATKTGWNSSPQIRLFRNLPNIEYRNRIHESLQTSLKNGNYQSGLVPITITHLGYNVRDKATLLRKLARNNMGMFKDLAERPEDMYLTERLYTSLKTLYDIGEIKTPW